VTRFRSSGFEIRTWPIALLVVALTLGIAGVPSAVGAQQLQKVFRVGYLESGAAAPGAPLFESFRQGLRDAGWAEGQNIAIEVRAAEGKYERLPGLALSLSTSTWTSSSPRSLRRPSPRSRRPRRSPSSLGVLPIRSGADSLAVWRTQAATSLDGRTWPGVTREICGLGQGSHPWIHSDWCSVEPGQSNTWPSLKNVEAAARALKLQLYAVRVQDPEKLESALSALTQKRAEALVVFPDGCSWPKETGSSPWRREATSGDLRHD